MHTVGLSLRKVSSLVGYSSLYEYEDFIQDVSVSSLVEIDPQDYQAIENSRRVYKALRQLDRSRITGNFLSRKFIPKDPKFQIIGDSTLFLPTFNNPYELFSLQAVEGWRDRCRYAVCYINEVWESDLKKCTYLLELLRDFDYIFIGLHHGVESLSKLVGKPCAYLPIGIDALKFCAYTSNEPFRSINVCNIGRRSDITHRALMGLAIQNHIFYYYDTIASQNVTNAAKQITFSVKSPKQHRLLLANLLKRSRYFIVNRAFVNDPSRTGGQSEIPSRFFEGAAAGTVMIGEPPNTQIFQEYFGWDDAIIQVPFDAPHIGEVILELEAQPERVAAIRRTNTINALLKHDWLHRLQVVYDALDLPASEKMQERAKQISNLVDHIHQLAVPSSIYV